MRHDLRNLSGKDEVWRRLFGFLGVFPAVTCYIAATMPKYKVGDRVLVKLSGGRIVEATIKAVVEPTTPNSLISLLP